jgi:hypothetical protein
LQARDLFLLFPLLKAFLTAACATSHQILLRTFESLWYAKNIYFLVFVLVGVQMQFLKIDETSRLHSILANHILITNETARADMLVNCGLSLLIPYLSSLGSSSLLFVNELCARLSRPHTIVKPSGQPGLVALLNFIAMPPYDIDLTEEDKRFLENVKQKCLQWHASQIQK